MPLSSQQAELAANSFANDAVFGLAIMLDVSLGRNIVHAFVSYASVDGSLADPWVPLHRLRHLHDFSQN